MGLRDCIELRGNYRRKYAAGGGKWNHIFIDPIDGTTNFLFDYHHSCVSVGVAVDGVLQEGFVHNPYVREMFHAVRGQGSWCNDRRLQMDDLRLKDGIVAFGCAKYNEDHTDLLFNTMKKLFYQSLSIRNGGSAYVCIYLGFHNYSLAGNESGIVTNILEE